jgi:hypothetical protein
MAGPKAHRSLANDRSGRRETVPTARGGGAEAGEAHCGWSWAAQQRNLAGEGLQQKWRALACWWLYRGKGSENLMRERVEDEVGCYFIGRRWEATG